MSMQIRHHIGFAWVLFFLLAGCANTESQPAVPEDQYIEATVDRVVDGDTMNVTFNGQEETVRLLLVDTPETKHPDEPVQPFGPEASEFAEQTLEGKDVKLEIDVSERDQYGRLLAYLWVGDKMFNELLLEKGLARVAYVFPPNVKYVDQFREIQENAQQEGIGIWSIDGYVHLDHEHGFHEEVVQQESEVAGCTDPTIKGNINREGEKIYHVPDGQYYEATKAEEMFCTEAEAVAAGFRASKR